MSVGAFRGLPRRFSKMSGAGNDFLVFGEPVSVSALQEESIRDLCRRGTGVGADGVLFVYADSAPGAPERIRADYYNADAGPAPFCANGTRCAARFARLKGLSGAELVVVTGWGLVRASVFADGRVRLLLPEPVTLEGELPTFDMEGAFTEPAGVSLRVGVPHLVVFTSPGVDLDRLDVEALGVRLRFHPALPEGANVHFTSVRGDARLAVRSYERGVEAETLSCGSGVVAAAVVAAVKKGQSPPITVETRSGVPLVVGFRIEGERATDVTLTGEARLVFEGTLAEESP